MRTPENPLLEQLSQFNPQKLGRLEVKVFRLDFVSGRHDHPYSIRAGALLLTNQFLISFETAYKAESIFRETIAKPTQAENAVKLSAYHLLISRASGLGYDHMAVAQNEMYFRERAGKPTWSDTEEVDLLCSQFSLIYGIPKSGFIKAMEQRVYAFRDLNKEPLRIGASIIFGEGEKKHIDWHTAENNFALYYSLLRGAIRPQRVITA